MRLRSGPSSRLWSVLALCAGLSVCGNANAQGFFVSYSNLIVASCTPTQISGSVNASYSLPAANNNLVAFVRINGGPQATAFYTQNPPTFSGPLGFIYPIPSTPQPYTISADVLPAQGGAPTGTGVSGAFTCNLDGSVTAVFNPTEAPTAANSVPTLSTGALVALALVLSLGAALRFRPRKG